MKKIKKTYFSIINKIIAIIAALTGLQACGPAIPTIHPLYSPPAPLPLAYFSISGRVETKLNTPIPNIKVTAANKEMEDINREWTCDNLGNFYIGKEYYYDSEAPQEINLIFTDIDGIKYGSFKSDTINIPLEYEDNFTEVTDLVVTLEEKEQNNNEENDNE